MALFPQDQLEAIADALGDTEQGLTATEIMHLFFSSELQDPGPLTKRVRIYNAFARSQNTRHDRSRVLGFIRQAMKPPRYSRNPERYEPLRANLNRALAFAGLMVDQAGELLEVDAVHTLPEATRRAQDLRADLESRGLHLDVLRFCRAELLVDNYFHAVQEAVKSVADKLRMRTGLTDDGSALVDRALGGEPTMLATNRRLTPSEKNEQSGLQTWFEAHLACFESDSPRG